MSNAVGGLVANHLPANIQLMAATCVKKSGRVNRANPIDLGGGGS